ncbi:MAG: SufD family Fe-S cluster assembly protein [Candidatus Berkiella sp.]
MWLDNLTKSFNKVQPFLPGYGHPLLRSLRQNAFDQACHLNIPSVRQSEWKHARFDTLVNNDFAPCLHAEAKQTLKRIVPYIQTQSNDIHIVFVNGHYVASLSSHPNGDSPVRLQSLARLAKTQPELLVDFQHRTTTDFFTLLNTAFCSDGAVVIIPEHIEVNHHIIIFHFLLNDTGPIMVHPQTFIHLGKHSKATIIEKTISLESSHPGLFNSQTTLMCDNSAKCDYYHQAMYHTNTLAFHRLNTILFAQSLLNIYELAFGAHYQRHQMNLDLKESQAELNCYGLLLPDAFEHCELVSFLHHYAPQGHSLQKIKSIIAESGHSSFLGNIAVNQAALQTQTLMINDNLLLGEKGQADSAPQLEILADEVKCNHAASISQIAEQALFYLQTRGLDIEQARQLLLQAFANDMLANFPSVELRQSFNNIILERLARLQRGHHEHAIGR